LWIFLRSFRFWRGLFKIDWDGGTKENDRRVGLRTKKLDCRAETVYEPDILKPYVFWLSVFIF